MELRACRSCCPFAACSFTEPLGAELLGAEPVALCKRWRRGRYDYAATLREEKVLEYPARIKVHQPCRAGVVLVELAGEFDVSCLVALRHALRRASGLGRRTFVDLAGVSFVDTLCLGELLIGSNSDDGPPVLCRPSPQFRLSVDACGLEGNVEFYDPSYEEEAVVAEAGRCREAKRPLKQEERHLYMRA